MARIVIYAKEDLAEQMALVLSMHGHSPICSEKMREALRQIITFRPSIVIAEYLEIDGEQLCREIRKIKQLENTQLIVMSELGPNLNEDNFRSAVLAFRANGYLRKPFPCQEIASYVESLLRAS